MAEQVTVARRILVGMEGSQNANDAFEFYMKHIHRPNDYVIVGYCPDLSSGVITSVDTLIASTPGSMNEAISSAADKAVEVQKFLEGKLHHAGAKGHVEILAGSNPGHALVKEADKENVAMIVIGSRGHGAIRRTLLGSHSGYVMHHSHVPVIVHPHHSHHHSHDHKDNHHNDHEKN